MFSGGLPGLLAGLGTFSFGGFHLFGLPSHWVSVAFRADGLFRAFVRGCCGGQGACISKPRTHPCHAGCRMQG